MGKYAPLQHYLERLPPHRREVTMRFGEVHALIKGGLPKSAYAHRPWWANRSNPDFAGLRGWQAAGFLTSDVDIEKRSVTFVRGEVPGPEFTARPMSIAEAKAGLAKTFGVEPDAIEISIRA